MEIEAHYSVEGSGGGRHRVDHSSWARPGERVKRVDRGDCVAGGCSDSDSEGGCWGLGGLNR